MQKLTFTNESGTSIVLQDYKSTGPIYRLMSLEDMPMDSPSITQKGYRQDGVTYKYTRAEPRAITLRGLFTGSGFADMQEKAFNLKGIFNPRLGEGTLKYENDYLSKEIDVKVETEPIIPNYKNSAINEFTVAMTAYVPFWRDLEYTEVNLVGVSGGLDFDSPSFEFVSGSTFTLGDLSGSSAIATNSGHLPAPLRIEWTGAATDPKLTLDDTGEFILLDKVLTSNQRLIITTGFDDVNVYIETISTGAIVKDFSIVDDTSTFFQLPIGNSTISFSATAGGSDSVVIVKYKKLYIGV